jgi:hypothetical protein
MTIEYFIGYLNRVKPNEIEIAQTLDNYDQNSVSSIIDMFDYRINDKINESRSPIHNCIYNTNVCEKGLDHFYFVSTLVDENFAYTDDDNFFFLEGSSVYLQYENDYKLISTSETDFLYGLLCCFKVNIDFTFRKFNFDLNECLLEFAINVPNNNSDYFIQRLKTMYSGYYY